MAYQLILETSSKDLAVGVARDGKVIHKTQYSAWQKQSEYTMVEVQKALQSVGIQARDISRIIVSNGPGSYTGVRIALTIAKVMASLLNCKLCVISSLGAIAGIQGKKIAIMDARSNRAYVGVYINGVAQTNDQVMSIPALESFIQQNPDYSLVGDVKLLQQQEQTIDYIQNLLDLSSITVDVKEVDIITPCYLKD